MNMPGALIYLLEGKVKKKKTNFSNTFSHEKIQRINKLIPILTKIEKFIPSFFGLSIVAVVKK